MGYWGWACFLELLTDVAQIYRISGINVKYSHMSYRNVNKVYILFKYLFFFSVYLCLSVQVILKSHMYLCHARDVVHSN